MSEADPCADEPDGSVRGRRDPAPNRQAEQEIALDAGTPRRFTLRDLKKPPFSITTVPVGPSNMLRGDNGAVLLVLTWDRMTASSRPESRSTRGSANLSRYSRVMVIAWEIEVGQICSERSGEPCISVKTRGNWQSDLQDGKVTQRAEDVVPVCVRESRIGLE